MPVTFSGQFHAVDLTGQVKQWAANPGSNFGIALQPALSAPDTVAFIDSKEDTGTARVAQLDVTLADQGPAGLERVHYVRSTTTLNGHAQGARFANCTVATVVVSGGCGHRDFDTAADGIVVDGTGPNASAPSSQWRRLLDDTRGEPRAVEAWALCMPANSVTGP